MSVERLLNLLPMGQPAAFQCIMKHSFINMKCTASFRFCSQSRKQLKKCLYENMAISTLRTVIKPKCKVIPNTASLQPLRSQGMGPEHASEPLQKPSLLQIVT